MKPESFAQSLKNARQSKNLTMLEVSELTGIALPIYKMIESGRLYPDHERLLTLLEVLELSWPHEVADTPQND